MEKLHPGARWLFRFQGYIVGLFLAAIILGLLLRSFLEQIFVLIVIYVILVLIFGEIFARWYYNTWKYEFTQDNLKIEKGIIVKTYKSIPYERVQNVDIRRGILARMLGFSTLDIQTAGYSGYYGRGGRGLSEGHIPALSIENAEKFREFLMKKISGKKAGI